ncbi:MAG: MFS transporter [Promethearchaeota archaeon]
MSAKKNKKTKYKQLTPLWMGVFSDIIGFSIMQPLVAFFVATPMQAALLMAVNGLFSFLSAPIWGRLSDKLGRKPMLLLSQLGTFAGFLLMAFSGESYILLITSRIVDGTFGGNFPITKAVISDVVEPHERSIQMSNIGVAHNVANLFGPGFGGLLYGWFGIIGPGLAAAVTSLLTFIVTASWLTETAPIKVGLPEFAKKMEILNSPIAKSRKKPTFSWTHNRMLMILLSQLAFSSLAFMLVMSNMAMFAKLKVGITPTTMGLLLSLSGIFQIIVRFTLLKYLIKHKGDYATLIYGYIGYLITFAMFGFVQAPWNLIVIFIFLSFSTSAIRAILVSFVSVLADPREQGKVQGVASSIDTFAQIIGPLAGGLLLQFLPLTLFGITPFVLIGIGFSLMHFNHGLKQKFQETQARRKAQILEEKLLQTNLENSGN